MVDMNCPICQAIMAPHFQACILGRYDVAYYLCPSCGLLRTEDPYWLDEAYRDPIIGADTGLVSRNIAVARKLAAALFQFHDPRGAYLDLAGGYGLLVRLMRDQGFDFYWDDPYAENLMALGFERAEATRPFVAVTAYEVLEHVHDPVAFLEQALSSCQGEAIYFSTEVYEGPEPPAPEEWWYYALHGGQHITFYRRDTLALLARRLGLHYTWRGSFQVFSRLTLSAWAFRLVTSPLGSTLMARWIRRRLSSKVAEDSEKLAAAARRANAEANAEAGAEAGAGAPE